MFDADGNPLSFDTCDLKIIIGQQLGWSQLQEVGWADMTEADWASLPE